MEYFTLYNGVKIPKVGFGTYKVIDQSAQGIVETALSVGYRHLDTARMYMNEKEVGAGIAASGVARKDIFLTTKVWRDDLSYDATMASVENSLKDLGTDYLDLCLLHWPMPETDREKWQEKERNIQNKMKHIIDNIKAVYKGDQRYLLIRTCHRINGYKIIYAFRGVLGLLIQIPFFIAAYNFIYSLSDLSQGNLFFIKDFSKPDNLINGINLLPFTMTIFSILAGMVYSKKLTIKESMPLYITSLIFLIILYNSPSGLLFYWNINCLFYLIKNIVLEYKLYKALNKDKILKICNISIFNEIVIFNQ